MHRYLTTPVKNLTAALQEEGETQGRSFSMHCHCDVQSPSDKDCISKIHSEMQKSNKHCESSSKPNQMAWAQMTGVFWPNFSGLDCISICYCSTVYERTVRISHVLSGASLHKAGQLMDSWRGAGTAVTDPRLVEDKQGPPQVKIMVKAWMLTDH